MNKTSNRILAALPLLAALGAAADDQTNYAFDDGSVIIHCAAPSKESQIDSTVFLEAFPRWITNLQTYANDGTVARAHYLSELKQGIFVVVLGENKQAAMQNALTIQAENAQIMKDALAAAGVEGDEADIESACDLIEIGPVAVLPMP